MDRCHALTDERRASFRARGRSQVAQESRARPAFGQSEGPFRLIAVEAGHPEGRARQLQRPPTTPRSP